VVAALALLPVLGATEAYGCAFEDVNDNGIFDGGDVAVADAAWLGGAAFVSNNPFVVPVGCERTLVGGLAVTQGVRVTATKVTFHGKLDYLPPGGRGVVFIADPAGVPAPNLGNGDLIVGDGINLALIKAGGLNALPAATIAVAQKSVALVGTGECSFNNAEIRGNAPVQNTKVGILCTGDLTFRNATVVGSKVNIQSLIGSIDGQSSAAGPPGASLADLCDDPVANLVGGAGAPGDGNGVVDAADFPCQLNLSSLGNTPIFPDAAALLAFCTPSDRPVGINRFQAFNDPLIMIAGAGLGNDLDLSGSAAGRTSVVGFYRVTLAAEDGNILTQNTDIDHGEQLGLHPPGGARIWLFADPTSVVRLPVDREDMLGPSAGTTEIAGSCYQSPNPVQVGRDAGGLIHVNGVPLGPPCKQNPPDFVPVLNGIF
jgi:hypothetical protein